MFKSLKGNLASAEVKKAYNFWVDHETRRRIFQSCFVLDTLQSTLFGQQLVLVQIPSSHGRGANLQGDMPFPCSSTLWDSLPGPEWCSHASSSLASDNVSLRDATAKALSDRPDPMDSFQAILVLSQILMHHRRLPSFSRDLEKYGSNITLYAIAQQASSQILVEFTYHALVAAFYTPVHKLLIVSGESWLYGRKLEDEADFRDAKSALRKWVDAGTPDKIHAAEADVLKAVWHAAKALALVIGLPSPTPYPAITIEGTGFSSEEQSSVDDVRPPLNVLHESWSVYLCGLICWAYGFDSVPNSMASTNTTSSERASISSASQTTSTSSRSYSGSTSSHAPLMPMAVALDEARNYLAEMTTVELRYPGDLLHLDAEVRSKTDGLLETIRTRKLSDGDGGLMNEAERVLYRLVEKRGRGWAF